MLITDKYRQQNCELHKDKRYGTIGGLHAKSVLEVIDTFRIKSILDYGCGKGMLEAELYELREGLDIRMYDPAIEEYSKIPEPADLVVCIDVLEHVEPDCLNNVLDDLERVVANLGFFTIPHIPAIKILPDGRNAHLTQEPWSWWKPKLKERFNFASVKEGKRMTMVLVVNK